MSLIQVILTAIAILLVAVVMLFLAALIKRFVRVRVQIRVSRLDAHRPRSHARRRQGRP